AVAAFANTTDLRNIGLDTTELSEPGGGAGVEGGPDATASVTPAGPTESSGPGGEGGSTVTPGTGSTVTPGTGSTVTPGAGAGATAGPGGGSTAAVRPEAEATGPAEAGATAGPAATTRPSVTASPRPLAAAGTAASRVVFFVAAALTVCGAVLMGVAGQHDRRQ
ncbi:MAG: hypothetical protein LBR33_01295, partial [Propionibacteriaceae bacterium]|nr:hypothetical protein [Propionibacteriaceae bacterium]